MVATNNGFEIAEADLKLRGPGDIQGTQQSGILDLKLADISGDEKILKYARARAIDLLDKDPMLQNQENLPIRRRLTELYRNSPGWEKIS